MSRYGRKCLLYFYFVAKSFFWTNHSCYISLRTLHILSTEMSYFLEGAFSVNKDKSQSWCLYSLLCLEWNGAHIFLFPTMRKHPFGDRCLLISLTVVSIFEPGMMSITIRTNPQLVGIPDDIMWTEFSLGLVRLSLEACLVTFMEDTYISDTLGVMLKGKRIYPLVIMCERQMQGESWLTSK